MFEPSSAIQPCTVNSNIEMYIVWAEQSASKTATVCRSFRYSFVLPLAHAAELDKQKIIANDFERREKKQKKN